jgi:hypothetical protein
VLRAPLLERWWIQLPMRLRGVIGFLNPVISGAAPRLTIDGFPHDQTSASRAESVAGDLLISYRRAP